MQPCKAAYKNCSQKSINFEKLCWVFLKIDGFPLEILSPNIPNSTDFASKSQISDEINSCSFCMCILRCFSERASKLHTSKGSSRRDKNAKIVYKKEPILPQSPKISYEINKCSFCLCILRCFSERASKLHKKRKFKLRSKWPPKRVYILPPSPKFLTRLIHVLFACASSDVSQKELQSSTQQKEVQSDIKSAKVVPKKVLILPHIPKFLMRAILVFI